MGRTIIVCALLLATDFKGILALCRVSSGVSVRVLSVILGLRVFFGRHHWRRVVVIVVQVSRRQTSTGKM